MNGPIALNSDNSERVKYNKTEYPIYIRKGILSLYPDRRAIAHWHDDVEFILVLSGRMQYNVNGEIALIEEGNGIFVNTRQVHYGFSYNDEECIFVCILIHPMLLCVSRSVEKNIVAPVLNDGGTPFRVLHADCEWENYILKRLRDMYDSVSDSAYELKTLAAACDIWGELYGHAQCVSDERQRNARLTTLKKMTAYIETYYCDRISLEDIARAGSVGKTGCCSIFKQYVNKTPNVYLTEFRLHKSTELLADTDLTVTEICYAVGFSGASYFTETFIKYLGCTPTEYRKRLKP